MPSQKQTVGLGLQVERELAGATWLSGGLAEAPPSLDKTLPSFSVLGRRHMEIRLTERGMRGVQGEGCLVPAAPLERPRESFFNASRGPSPLP